MIGEPRFSRYRPRILQTGLGTVSSYCGRPHRVQLSQSAPADADGVRDTPGYVGMKCPVALYLGTIALYLGTSERIIRQ